MRQGLMGQVLVGLLAAVVAGSVAAANKPAAKKKPAGKPAASNHAAGKKVFEQSGCFACHKIAGKGGTAGPDLSRIGKEHNEAWISKKIKDPKVDTPKSLMPAFNGTPQQLKAVSAYLASLK